MQELRSGAATALKAWEEAKSIGTIILPVGYGKTRLGPHAKRSVGALSTLVVTSKIPLIKQWQQEFENNGVGEGVSYMCIQSAYKKEIEVELLIVDECHKTLSPLFRNMYSIIKYKYLICLSATPPREREYREFMDSVAPIVYEKSLLDAVREESVSDYLLYNKAIGMSKSTRAKYNAMNRVFMDSNIKLSVLARTYKLQQTIFDIAKTYKDVAKHPIQKPAKAYWMAMSMRKNILYSNPEKLIVCKQIVDQNPGRKWIIFAKSIKFASDLALLFKDARVYHSKLKKEQREQVLQDYADNQFSILVAVDALTEGLNVPNVDAAISASGTSSVIEQIQRMGRALRFIDGKVGLYFNLYVVGTPEEQWITTKTIGLNPIYI